MGLNPVVYLNVTSSILGECFSHKNNNIALVFAGPDGEQSDSPTTLPQGEKKKKEEMEGWRDGCRDLEDLLGGLEDPSWCLACGVYGHTVAICPFQGEEEEEPAQERKVGRRKRTGKGKLQQQPQHQPEEQQPGCYCCAEPGHSSTNCPWYPLRQLPQLCPICGGEHYVARCPVHPEREEQGSPQSPPPAGGGRMLLPPPQPQLQQRPEEPENLFPWCTWCGKVDHRWRDSTELVRAM
ncbi:UNVERIFIED_CONTAM: hypothetical protein FKN15_035805 [Acipenser sinensis]